MQKLIMDADGVLLEYDKAFITYLRKQGLNYGQEYWRHPGFFDYIERFSHTQDFGKMQAPFGAQRSIEMLARHFDIHIVTAPGDKPNVVEARIHNLTSLFPAIKTDQITCLPLLASKYDVLSNFDAGSIFVDDNLLHIRTGEDVGLQSLWFKEEPGMYFSGEREAESETGFKPIVGWPDLVIEISEIGRKYIREQNDA